MTNCIVGAGLMGLTAGCEVLRVLEPSQRAAQCAAMSSSWAPASLKPALPALGFMSGGERVIYLMFSLFLMSFFYILRTFFSNSSQESIS